MLLMAWQLANEYQQEMRVLCSICAVGKAWGTGRQHAHGLGAEFGRWPEICAYLSGKD